jgi:hypothetical protein
MLGVSFFRRSSPAKIRKSFRNCNRLLASDIPDKCRIAPTASDQSVAVSRNAKRFDSTAASLIIKRGNVPTVSTTWSAEGTTTSVEEK